MIFRPGGQIRKYSVDAMLCQEAASLLAVERIWRKELIQQRRFGCLRQFRLLQGRAALVGHAPDPAVDSVPPRIAEIDLAVLDDRIGPVGDVKGPVRTELHIDWA